MEKKIRKILIVDDEEDLCEILQFNLEGEGYETDIAYSAEQALKKDLSKFDLILLDVMMEQMSGFKMAEKVKKELKITVPIIFITAKNTENDLLTGFSLGGDDYITKPFSVKEVIARVKAVLGRSNVEVFENPPTIQIDDLSLDFKSRTLQLGENEIILTKKEFEILAILLKNQERIFSRDEIMSHVWDDNTIVVDRTVDVHITRLRKKIGKYGKYLKSKPGYGYSFNIK